MGLIYKGVPEKLALSLAKKKNIKLFVETGTYMGDTTKWAAGHFEKVITIEAAEVIYNKTKETLKPYPNIRIIFGESNNELGKLSIHEPAFFWLDAHYSAGETFNGELPLLKELEIINSIEADSYVLIDDARLILAKWLDEQYCDVADLISILRQKNRYIAIFEDVIIAVPYHAKDIVNDYTNEMSRVYWEQYLNPGGKQSEQPFLRRAFKKLFS